MENLQLANLHMHGHCLSLDTLVDLRIAWSGGRGTRWRSEHRMHGSLSSRWMQNGGTNSGDPAGWRCARARSAWSCSSHGSQLRRPLHKVVNRPLPDSFRAFAVLADPTDQLITKLETLTRNLPVLFPKIDPKRETCLYQSRRSDDKKSTESKSTERLVKNSWSNTPGRMTQCEARNFAVSPLFSSLISILRASLIGFLANYEPWKLAAQVRRRKRLDRLLRRLKHELRKPSPHNWHSCHERVKLGTTGFERRRSWRSRRQLVWPHQQVNAPI